ncbi:monooxygenase [Aeromicrobium chenweiae]|uniref:Monooxygenase n=1 Tax=Aeromicrobium chenweiae TaxID=2079793 RepID=A0A2S0WHW7_9ACTN|nr:monooxygenase [Aeromicrobium chenweiae]AWB90935.1 monooxygenase [Aeromicrobium chenweiae]TGN32155.1 monooxygenase [Aeromicrobium chenweiae]
MSEVAVLHVWGTRSVPSALWRMGRDRVGLRSTPGLRFAKLLGTGSGETFTLRDADPHHWATLTVWDDDASARAFDSGRLVGAWDSLAHERLRVVMSPLSSRGSWSGAEPFTAEPFTAEPSTVEPAERHAGPVAAITRARLRVRRAATFWRAVPPVSSDLQGSPGLRMSLGIGEAPIGLQGTFSLWESSDALVDFAYRRAPHREVVRRTASAGWYAEELFARFALREVEGTYRGTAP